MGRNTAPLPDTPASRRTCQPAMPGPSRAAPASGLCTRCSVGLECPRHSLGLARFHLTFRSLLLFTSSRKPSLTAHVRAPALGLSQSLSDLCSPSSTQTANSLRGRCNPNPLGLPQHLDKAGHRGDMGEQPYGSAQMGTSRWHPQAPGHRHPTQALRRLTISHLGCEQVIAAP